MSRIITLAMAAFAGGVLSLTTPASAQMPDYNSLSQDCQGKYNDYINSYNDYGATTRSCTNNTPTVTTLTTPRILLGKRSTTCTMLRTLSRRIAAPSMPFHADRNSHLRAKAISRSTASADPAVVGVIGR